MEGSAYPKGFFHRQPHTFQGRIHLGNGDGAVFTRVEEGGEAITDDQAEENQKSSYVLTSATRYTGLKPLYNDSSWNGGYFYSDMTEDGLTVIVNCSAVRDEKADGTRKKFRKKFARLVSESKVKNYKESNSYMSCGFNSF